MLRAVLDTNVWVSASISLRGNPAKVVQALYADAFDLVISEKILLEIDRVFHCPKITKRHGWSEEEIRRVIARLRRIAHVTPGKLTVNVIDRDEADTRFLDCAVEGHAEYIVSGDRDLLDLKTYEGIEIMDAREFLETLRPT